MGGGAGELNAICAKRPTRQNNPCVEMKVLVLVGTKKTDKKRSRRRKALNQAGRRGGFSPKKKKKKWPQRCLAEKIDRSRRPLFLRAGEKPGSVVGGWDLEKVSTNFNQEGETQKSLRSLSEGLLYGRMREEI